MATRLPTSKKWLFAGVIVLFSAILLAGLLEGGLRIRQWIKYRTPSAMVYNFLTKDDVTGLRVPVAGFVQGGIRINSLGFRSPELQLPKPLARIRLGFLGGSTTFGAEASRNETTWPHLVWRSLQDAYPTVGIDYVNAGVAGYATSTSLRNLEYRVKPLAPDVIIIYHATNDLSFDTRQLAIQQRLYEGKPSTMSWLAKWSLTWFFIEKNVQLLTRQRGAINGTRRLVFEPRQLSQPFRRQLIELIRAAQGVAPVVAVATFSHKLRRDQTEAEQLKAANTSLYYMPYMSMRGLLAAFDEYNRVIREVAETTHAILIAGEERIPGDDVHFHDAVHFTDAGNGAMARRVVTSIMQSEKFGDLLTRGRKVTTRAP